MKHIYFFLFFVLAGLHIHAQQITVTDKVTLKPLEFVTVFSLSGNASAMTNINGQADISAFKNANDIKIRLVGFQPKQMTWDQLEAVGFKITLEPSQVYLDEVVVSASRWEQESVDVPNKITSITPAQVSLQNPQTAADLLATSGGVFIQKSQLGGGSPMIRGFAANRVLITVDGVRMNNAIFRSGNLQNVISVDPFSLRTTEVVYGPGAVIYGSDAIGGVMNFYTLRPYMAPNGKPLFKANALVRYATANNEKTGHVDFNIGLKKWAFVTSISFSDYDDLKMGSHGPDDYLRPEYVQRINGVDSIVANSDPKLQVPTGFNMLNLMQKIRFRPNDHWDFTYGFHYSTTSDYPRYDRLIRYRDGKLRSAEWYYGPQVWMMNNLQVTNSKATKIYDRFSISLAHQYFEESRHDRDYQVVILTNRYENVNVVSANADFEKRLNESQILYYGAEMQLNSVTSTGNDENIDDGTETVAASRYPDGSTQNSFAIYGSYLNKISEKLSFQGGLRYNHVLLNADFDTTFYPFPFTSTSLTNGAITGSAGLNFRPTEDWLLKFNLSSGFRAPNIDDVGKVFDSEPGTVIVPNPDLKPEYAWSGEFAISRLIQESVEIDVSVFYTLLNDAMVRRDFTLNGQDSIIYDGELSRVEAVQNAANAWVYGIQADIEADLMAGFGLRGNFNYQVGEEELDDGSTAPMRHVAPVFGSLHLSWSGKRMRADLYGVFNGEIAYADLAPSEQGKSYLYASDSNGNPYSPSWYTLNFKFLYQATENLQVNLGLENITDQRYRPYSSGIAAAGRNFIASLKFSL
jgi:hemoglobin/transferrin/lactoferrin receptor protein